MEILLGFGVLAIVFLVLGLSNGILKKLSNKETKDKVLFSHGRE
jgi:hypothetical protein